MLGFFLYSDKTDEGFAGDAAATDRSSRWLSGTPVRFPLAWRPIQVVMKGAAFILQQSPLLAEGHDIADVLILAFNRKVHMIHTMVEHQF